MDQTYTAATYNGALVPKIPVKKVYFLKDGDSKSKPVHMAIKPKDYRSGIEKLEDDLTEKCQLPAAARSIYTSHGRHAVRSLEDFQDGGYYVVSTKRKARGVDLQEVNQAQSNKWIVTGRSSEASAFGFYPPPEPRNAWASPTSTRYSSDRESGYSSSTRDSKGRPKKVYLFRNGNSKICHTMLLNSRTAMNFEQVKQDMNDMFGMNIVKIFTPDGEIVEGLSGLMRGPDKFYVAGYERFKGPGDTPRDSSPEKKQPKYEAPAPNYAEERRDRPHKTRGKWTVRVVTSEDDAAGTEANVALTAYGARGASDPIPLGYNDGDLFQSCNTDEFDISVGRIGDLYKIRVQHDDPRESWLLDQVWLYDKHSGEELHFTCRRWLSRARDDGEICRELPVSRPGEKMLPVVVYEVTVHTGDVWNGGTGATVFVTLHGERGDSGVREFYRRDASPDLGKGANDSFTIEAVFLGKLKKCVVGHDGTGAGNGWYLEKVVVKELNKPYREFAFPCMRWLDEGEDDGKTVRELKLQGEFTSDQVEKARWEYEKWKFMSGNQLLLFSALTEAALRVRTDGAADCDADHTDPHAVFNVIPRKNQVIVLQNAKSRRLHLGIENSKISGQTRGDATSEFRIRVQENRSILLESLKFPNQHLTVTRRGTMGDPRTHDIDASKLFYAFCKGMFRDQGTIMFYTSLIQVLNVDGDNGLVATGKKNRLAFFKVHKVSEGGVRMFESVVHPRHFVRLKKTHVDILGNGDSSCHFQVHKVREHGFVRLQSCENSRLYLGMAPDGRVQPVRESDDVDVRRFYPEVIEFGLKKEKKTERRESDAKPVVTKPQKHKLSKRMTHTVEPVVLTPTPEPETEPEAEYEDDFEEDPKFADEPAEDGDWKVWITTEEAGRDGSVVMVVYGDKGNSGQIMLGKCGTKHMFKSGNVDEFKINLKSVGKLYKIRLELIPMDRKLRKLPSWAVKEVKMKDFNTKETLKFKFNCWLSTEEEDGDLMRERPAVRPGKDAPPLVRYRVWVRTGQVDSAELDPDAHVHLCLYGERGDTGKRLVSFMQSDHKEKFLEGQVDVFEVEAVRLGALSHAVVGHDGAGPGEGWFLDSVVVQEASEDSDTQWMFPCRKWLDSGVGDKKLERTLKAVEPKEEPAPKSLLTKKARVTRTRKQEATDQTPQPQEGDWQVVVTTGKEKQHATKNKVVLVVYGLKDGESRQSEPLPLDKPVNARTPFQAGASDEFKVTIDTETLGKLYKIRIGHNNENPQSGWFLDKIKLKCLKTKEQFNLRCGRYLQQGQDDNDTWRELALSPPGEKPLPTVKYRLTVHTGDEPSAEPDADARFHVQLFGSRGDSGARCLYKSLNHDEWFVRGQTDEFEVEAVSLDDVTHVKIGHNVADTGGGWYLSHVEVREGEGRRARAWLFPCRKWLDGGIDDNLIERTLSPGPLPDSEEPMEVGQQEEEEPEAAPEPGDWAVWVTTGSNEGADTTNPVFLSVYGEDGIYRDVELNKHNHVKQTDETKTDAEKKILFGKGSTDEFKVNLSDIGEIYKIRIGHGDSDRESGWYLEKVKLRDLATEETFTFRCNRWLRRDEDDRDVWRELPVVRPGQQPRPVIRYRVEVHTADEPGADTEASLFIQLFGSGGDSGRRLLFHSLNHPDDALQAGQMDLFEVEAVTLETMQKIIIGHEETGKGAGWKCEKVIVREGDSPGARLFYFPCGKWLDAGTGDKKIVREILPADPPQDSRGEYTVWVSTAHDSAAPCGSVAVLTVYGDRGRSRDVALRDDGGGFEPGTTDEFDEVRLGDLGEVYKLRVGREDADNWAEGGWHLQQVKLQDKHSGKLHVFDFDRWLDRGRDDHDVVRELPVRADGDQGLPMQHYEILVYTGNHWAAGTDANVHITLFGSQGDSGKRWLYHSDSNPTKFQRNQVDVFVLEAVSLGELRRVVVGHDGRGHGAGWFLDRVVVRQRDGADTDALHVFSCNRWLDDHEDDCSTERELRLLDTQDGSQDPPEMNDAKTVGEWTLRVKTSDVHNAGSRAQVHATVYGTEGTSALLPLGEAGGDDFLQGREAEFKVSVGDIGHIIKLRLQQDGSGDFPSLHVDRVEMTDAHTAETLLFYCDAWLAADEADGSLMREFAPLRPSLPSVPSTPVLRYQVAVFTSNIAKGGTTAQVSITLFGKYGDTGRRPLRDSRTHDEPFGKGQVDVFEVEAVRLGDLLKLELSHDGTDPDSAWHVEKVCVKETRHALTEHVFRVGRWLDPARGEDEPSRVEIHAPVEEPASKLPALRGARPEPGETRGRWTLWVQNGPAVPGEPAEEEEEELSEDDDEEEDRERKQKEKAEALKNTDISITVFGTTGATEAISLWDANDSWDNRQEEEKDEESNKKKVHKSKTKDDKGAKKEKGTKEVENEGKPERFKPDTVDEHKISLGEIGKIHKVRLTMDSKGAAVSVNLLKLKLKDADTGQEFQFVGREMLALLRPAALRASRRNPHAVLELPAIRPDLPPTPEVTYSVTVTTGDAERAETDARVYCVLHGGRGDSGRRALTQSNNDRPFLRNQVDRFEVTLLDIGKIEKITVGHEAVGRGRGWLCDHIVLRQSDDHTETVFPCHRWVDSGTEDRRLEVALLPLAELRVPPDEDDDDARQPTRSRGEWQCSVKLVESLPESEEERDKETSEGRSEAEKEDGEGDGFVAVTVCCEKGTTGPVVFETSEEHPFALATTEVFDNMVDTAELGAIVKIRVKDSMKQHRRLWSVEEVSLKDVDTKEELRFSCRAHVGHKLISDERIFQHLRDPENTANVEHNEVEVFALRHDRPVLPMVEYQVTVHTTPAGQDLLDNKDGDKEDENKNQKDQKSKSEDKKGAKASKSDKRRKESVSKSTATQVDARPPDIFPVHLQLFGRHGELQTDSGTVPLLHNQRGSHSFQPGQVDVFRVNAIDLGDLTKIKVTKGDSVSPWKLSKICVRRGQLGPTEDIFVGKRDLAFCAEASVELERSGFQLCEVAVPADETPAELPRSKGQWRMWSTTGIEESEDVRYALPRCLQLVLCGLRGDSRPVLLQPSSEYAFQIGEIDQFQFEMLEDIGDVFKIRLAIVEPPKEEEDENTDPNAKKSDKGKKDKKKAHTKNKTEERSKPKEETGSKFYSWYLEQLRFEDQDTHDVFTCTVDDWIRLDDVQDGIKELPVCWPKSKLLPVCKYEIETYTGDEENAETKATPYIVLFNQTGNSGKRRLLASTNTKPHEMFKRNQVDKFEFEAVQLYDLNKVVVGHDSTDPGSGWFLDKVVVKELQSPNKQFVFECNRWLDSAQDDSAIERELLVKGPPTSKWKVRLTTGILPPDPSDEGTSREKKKKDTKNKAKAGKKVTQSSGRPEGTLVVVVYGDEGKSKDIPIVGVTEEHFQPGTTDEFEVDIPEDLGEVYKVRVGSVDGANYQWLLEKVSLARVGEDRELSFPLGDWLKKSDVDDGWREIPVQPPEFAEHVDGERTKKGKSEEETGEHPSGATRLPVHRYQVILCTGDKAGTALDSRVYLTVSGARGDTGKRALKKTTPDAPEKQADQKAETNRVEVFELEAVELLDLQRIRIGHESSGGGNGWFLEKVVIKEAPDAEKQFVFECNRWLDEDEDDGLLEREFELTRTEPEDKKWLVSVSTGDVEGAGTAAPVYLTVFGEDGDSGPLELGAPGDEAFERGTAEAQLEVKFKPAKVGKITKIRLFVDNYNPGEGWFCEQIVLTNPDDAADESRFDVSRWLDVGKDDGDVVREAGAAHALGEPGHSTKYIVDVTSETSLRDTEACHVHVILHGENGDSGKRVLLKSTAGKSLLFQEGTDTFGVEAVGLGKLQKLTIGHDVKDRATGWKVEKVVVEETMEGAEQPKYYVFPCNKSLDCEVDDKEVERELRLEGAEDSSADSSSEDSDSGGDH